MQCESIPHRIQTYKCILVIYYELRTKLLFWGKCYHQSPIGFEGFEYGLWGIGFGGSPIGYEGSLSRVKVQGNFLVLCWATNFDGYSYVYISISNLIQGAWRRTPNFKNSKVAVFRQLWVGAAPWHWRMWLRLAVTGGARRHAILEGGRNCQDSLNLMGYTLEN